LRIVLLALLLTLTNACSRADISTQPLFQHSSFELLQSRPHNSHYFTQGLTLVDGYFYESSGHYGRSQLYRYPLAIDQKSWLQKIISHEHKQRSIDKSLFAEGLTKLDDKLYLLSWKAGRALSFDAQTLSPISEFNYTGQGWGLTDNGRDLIRSDGSDRLFFHHADNFSLLKQLQVRGLGRRWQNINELEYINGVIWANIWQEQIIIAIDADSGQVLQSVDLSEVVRLENPQGVDAVLNGIAYDHQRNALWVTGKNWRKLYLIRVSPTIELK